MGNAISPTYKIVFLSFSLLDIFFKYLLTHIPLFPTLYFDAIISLSLFIAA